jgi:transposase-like protein
VSNPHSAVGGCERYLGFPFALRLMRKLLKQQGFSPKLLITDKLRSHASALWLLGLSSPY